MRDRPCLVNTPASSLLSEAVLGCVLSRIPRKMTPQLPRVGIYLSHLLSPNTHWVSWDYFPNKLFALKFLTQNMLWGNFKLKMQRFQKNLLVLKESLLCPKYPSCYNSPFSAPLALILLKNIACPCMSRATTTSYC